jgi:hypothetical protein
MPPNANIFDSGFDHPSVLELPLTLKPRAMKNKNIRTLCLIDLCGFFSEPSLDFRNDCVLLSIILIKKLFSPITHGSGQIYPHFPQRPVAGKSLK